MNENDKRRPPRLAEPGPDYSLKPPYAQEQMKL